MQKRFAPLYFITVSTLIMSALGHPLPAHAAGGVCRVDQNAPINPSPPNPYEEGGTWDTAYHDLQSALAAGCGELWVADGVYVPGASASASFVIQSGIKLYGGFGGYAEGEETSESQRDWTQHITILSGDIGGDDLNADGNHIAETTADIQNTNSAHVIYLDGVPYGISAATVLDGFTITAGQNLVAGSGGAGMICAGGEPPPSCAPTIRHMVFSGNYAADKGGAVYDHGSIYAESSPSFTDVVFQGNYATYGGAVYNDGYGSGNLGSSPTFTRVIFKDNTAALYGGAVHNDGGAGGHSYAHFVQVTFLRNHAGQWGGAVANTAPGGGISSPDFTDAYFSLNTALSGGAVFNISVDSGHSDPTFNRVTFDRNSATMKGGAVHNEGQAGGFSNPVFANATFSGNHGQAVSSYGLDGTSNPKFYNTTFTGNYAAGDPPDPTSGGAIVAWANAAGGSTTTLYNSILWGDIADFDPEVLLIDTATINISYGVVMGGCASIPGATCSGTIVTTDPKLGALADNGGFAPTVALQPGSSALDAGSAAICSAAPVGGVDARLEPRPADGDGDGHYYCDMGAFEKAISAELLIEGDSVGSYYVPLGGRVTPRFDLQAGPVYVSGGLTTIFTSERVHNANGFINETMGIPSEELTSEYWYPWYDNLGMTSWILVSNPLSSSTVHVTINIAGTDYGPYDIGPGEVQAKQYPIMDGPVHITSDYAILTSERVATGQGFVQETMGYSNDQLTNEYWFPWYDNLGMISWILVGNPSADSDAHVTINIAGTDYGPYTIEPGDRITPQFGVMNGPVHVTSDINVFTSERVHGVNGFVQETMGYPSSQLATQYWFPWYDNLGMMSWILVGNPSTSQDAHVTINIAGTNYGPYTITHGSSKTPRFGVMNGPVHVTSDIDVFASERVHTGQGFVQETMGFANDRLAQEYWFPWYDNLSTMEWVLIGRP